MGPLTRVIHRVDGLPGAVALLRHGDVRCAARSEGCGRSVRWMEVDEGSVDGVYI